MKKLFPVIIVFLISCTGHYEKSDFNLMSVKNAMMELNSKVSGNKVIVEKGEWPIYLNELKAKAVHIGKKGIYIEIDRFFVDESGLFMPFNKNFTNTPGEDPEFILLDENIYSYHRKG